MKYNRIIKFTLTNAFILLVFASFLSSCEKQLYPSAGYFSNELSRTPASNRNPIFSKFQDPRQIYIYCEMNAPKVEVCYHAEFESSLKKYQEKYGVLASIEKNQLKQIFELEKMKASVESNLEKTINKLEPQINKFSNQRASFCKENSQKARERCLEQNIEKNTFTILNQFHQKVKLNGQEYLLTKKEIKEALLKKLKSLNNSVI